MNQKSIFAFGLSVSISIFFYPIVQKQNLLDVRVILTVQPLVELARI
jgi:hypothetical protein